jgi:tetratricopeptide (TPR) repeat protein
MVAKLTNDAECAIRDAVVLREQGRTDEAATLLERALQRYADSDRLWQTLGTVHRARGDSAAAATAFAHAARLAPHDPKPAHGVAQASLEAGRAAAALFERAQRLAPSDATILLGRAAALLAENRAAEAIAMLDAIVAANPVWLDGQRTLAQLRWMMGETSGFATGYARALMADTRQPLLWGGLIDVLIHVEQWEQAERMVSEARAALGDRSAYALPAAICAAELGSPTAEALFSVLDWGNPAVLEHRARHLLRTGRADAASTLLGSALERPGAERLWPYASLAWRLTGDPRAEWLEGDPALISVVDLDMRDALPALAERLRGLHRAKRDPLGQSVRGGTQTDGPLFAHEAAEIREFRRRVVEAVDAHLLQLGKADAKHPTRRHLGRRWRFAGSWSVRLTGEGHHAPHVHPLGWMSSACYVALPPTELMGAPPAGWLQLGAPPPSLNLPLKPLHQIEPRPGRLVLFPSTMWHGTVPIAAGERLTIAFDVAAIG